MLVTKHISLLCRLKINHVTEIYNMHLFPGPVVQLQTGLNTPKICWGPNNPSDTVGGLITPTGQLGASIVTEDSGNPGRNQTVQLWGEGVAIHWGDWNIRWGNVLIVGSANFSVQNTRVLPTHFSLPTALLGHKNFHSGHSKAAKRIRSRQVAHAHQRQLNWRPWHSLRQVYSCDV